MLISFPLLSLISLFSSSDLERLTKLAIFSFWRHAKYLHIILNTSYFPIQCQNCENTWNHVAWSA